MRRSGWARVGGAIAVAVLGVATFAAAAGAATAPQLDEALKRKLDENYRLSITKKKGPYSQNFCVCRDGRKDPVQKKDGRIVTPCGGRIQFCAAFREPWSDALGDEGMYVANLFARDLFLWDEFPDHNNLVRGYILEKFLIETNPKHKFSQLRAYGGLAGAEYEAKAAPTFFEKYLASPEFDEPRHYLLAYELQRRFYLRGDQGQIHKARNMATAIQAKRKDFKPLRDQVHNRIAAHLMPKLAAYRDELPAGNALRGQVDELIAEIGKLTSLDMSALAVQLPEIEDASVRAELEKRIPPPGADVVETIAALADLMGFARRTVEAKQVPPAERRRLIDVAITAGSVLHTRGSALIESGEQLTARQHIELLLALADAAYGSGLLMDRERESARESLTVMLRNPEPGRETFKRQLGNATRVVEWAQVGTNFAFEEARGPWTYLLPETALLGDDILRGSPLLIYADVLRRLEDFAAGENRVQHEIFGAKTDREVRALNPGLAFGELRVAPKSGDYSRNQILALPETPADLEPAAGILTRGEGNVVSHVQLLARALGIPNVVLGPGVYSQFEPNDGVEVLLVATPGGRVIVKKAGAMTDRDRAALAEYNRSQERTEDGALGGGGGGAKLHIDRERLDLAHKTAIDLATVRRADSGIKSGPKAAFLGELKHMFPKKVARGAVVPFGAYYEHYQRASVVVPEELAGQAIAEPGESLPDFVERTYDWFFGQMIPRGIGEKELSAWIQPRLAVMRESIVRAPLSDDLKQSIRGELERLGLLQADDPTQTVGLFVRSDTNVEDLDDFNGAGLNLTLFNLKSLEDVFAGLKRVWASPFTYRSFSWRQTLIDEPLWVLPSVVILESIPSEKSGVLVTADIDHGDASKMLIATSEGVGGAVDGTPAETLLWSADGVELITMFKSPFRRLLQEGGGSVVVASTGAERVLAAAEIDDLVSTAQAMRQRLDPSVDDAGRVRPWDVEYGFANGKLWLFQVRPFVGNESLRNVPALTGYDGDGKRDTSKTVSLDTLIP